jgi:formylglycine-generating enzyme required for sulfatase activity
MFLKVIHSPFPIFTPDNIINRHMHQQNETSPPLPDLDLAFVEGGSFRMGNNDEDAYGAEKIIHPVTVPAFYMAKFPVTQRLWIAVMGGEEHPSYFRGDLRPKTDVSWDDAKAFIKKLNALPDVQRFIRSLSTPGKEFRLPTEAEWEYAARGGNQSEGFKYAGSDKLNEVGWFVENSHNETKPAGMKFPNELGIFDMSGNVWEWCSDWFSDKYYEECRKKGVVENPPGAVEGADRVSRGGCYWSTPRNCRPSVRLRSWQVYRGDFLGFRLVLALQSVDKPSAFL